ncbi:7388_t:CDS:2, partial [Paraglomus brasilianum]
PIPSDSDTETIDADDVEPETAAVEMEVLEAPALLTVGKKVGKLQCYWSQKEKCRYPVVVLEVSIASITAFRVPYFSDSSTPDMDGSKDDLVFDYASVEEELATELEEEKENVIDITSNIDGDVYEDDILYENIW